MNISVAEISSIIKQQIADYDTSVDVSETGTVLTTGDGIARLHGLENAMAGELLEFPNEVVGMVLNLEEDNVGAVLFGDAEAEEQAAELCEEADISLLIRSSHEGADVEFLASDRVV